jgi:acyl carrier protein
MTLQQITDWLIDYLAKKRELDPNTITPETAFAELGLDSLGHVILTEDIGNWLGQDIDPHSAYEQETILAFAGHIHALQYNGSVRPPDEVHENGAASARASPVRVTVAQASAGLSTMQRGLCFADRLMPGTTVNTLACLVSLKGPLDLSALRQALQNIVDRHPILKTCWPDIERDHAGFIDDSPFVIERLDKASSSDSADCIKDPIRQFIHTPIDLTREPPLKAGLVRMAVHEHSLVLACHHIAFDGWSLHVLLDELSALYNALTTDTPKLADLLPVPVLHYAEYADQERHYLSTAKTQAALEYWADMLRAPPKMLDLPFDRVRPALPSLRGGLHRFDIPASLVHKARDLAKAQSTSLFTVLLAAYHLLLARLSRQSDLIVGTPVALRETPLAKTAIGPFINMLAIRCMADPKLGFGDFLDQVAARCNAALAHRAIPFDWLIKRLYPMRDLTAEPFFQAVMVFQNAPRSHLRMTGLDTGFHRLETDASRFDLSLIIEPHGADSLDACFEYSIDLFNAERVDWFGQRYQAILRAATENPDQKIGRIF